MSADLAAATGGIANVKIGTTLPVEASIIDPSARLRRPIDSYLESKTFPYDNPLNITEEEARKHGHMCWVCPPWQRSFGRSPVYMREDS
ncbi:hypothetical protein LZ31DRAFT_598146 [Colletotrichum somersetense]|nr:hypothetical protein LZ31DRAFT_598146 [Colletotrichum somersetense]